MGRKGVTPGAANHIVRNSNSVLAALMVKNGDADAMISGVIGGFQRSLGNYFKCYRKSERD